MKAWHFLKSDRRLGYGDGRLVEPGQTLTHKGSLVLCSSGLHGSEYILDALNYARGPIICRVELGGEIVEGLDKVVASERTCLWMVDGERILRLFAVWCARRALSRILNPDPRSIAACDVAERYANGEATAKELSAARNAAGAAWALAATDQLAADAWVAREAAETDAWSAARDAAWNARTTAGAAWAAAATDHLAAERKAQEQKLIELIEQERNA